MDDSASARMVAQDLLEEAGYTVLLARNGAEGLQAVQEAAPDLVVLDVEMPGLDGFETCRRIRETRCGVDLPVLFLTGATGAGLPDRALEAGGDDLIYKPSIQQELLIRVRSLLRIRRLTAELRKESDALREAQRQQRMLFRFIVHDLKSPLQALLSMADMVEVFKGSPDDVERMAALLRDVVGTMTRMVQDLLDIGHSEAGGLVLQASLFMLSDLFEECRSEMDLQLKRAGQRLHVEVPAGWTVGADRELLRRCLLNLLGNASKYGSRDSRIDLLGQACEGGVLLKVADRGPGIPPDMRERIFDPFVRLERDTGQARISSGLGLAFCRTAVEAHGGRIWIEDLVPKGTVFCLEIPDQRED